MKIENVNQEREALARQILENLPDWFGRKHARENYISEAKHLPMFAVFDTDANAIGFLSIKQHSNVTVEAYVLGVLPNKHRQGIGRSLFAYAERHLVDNGVRYLTVKTLAATNSDPNYANTRRFYEAIGFEPLEIFPTLWDSGVPCLFMVKPLKL
jgi:ribosomal protein S18 acetylase RimI-like enzyme